MERCKTKRRENSLIREGKQREYKARTPTGPYVYQIDNFVRNQSFHSNGRTFETAEQLIDENLFFV